MQEGCSARRPRIPRQALLSSPHSCSPCPAANSCQPRSDSDFVPLVSHCQGPRALFIRRRLGASNAPWRPAPQALTPGGRRPTRTGHDQVLYVGAGAFGVFSSRHRPRPDAQAGPGGLQPSLCKGARGGSPPAQEEECEGTAFLPLLDRRTLLAYSPGGPSLLARRRDLSSWLGSQCAQCLALEAVNKVNPVYKVCPVAASASSGCQCVQWLPVRPVAA